MKFRINKAVADVQWAFISLGTASLAHFLLRALLGRELGAEGLGIYTLAFTIYLLGMQFAAFGIGSAITKFVAEYNTKSDTVNNYTSSGLFISIVTGTLMGIILFLTAPIVASTIFHTPELGYMLQLIALCFPFISVQKAVLGALNGLRRMRQFAFLNIIHNVIVVVFSLLLVMVYNMGTIGAVFGLAIPTIIIGALSPLMISKYIKVNLSPKAIQLIRPLLSFGFFIVIGNSIGYLNTQIDSILIGFYQGPTEVGVYAVAILLAQSLTLLPTAIQHLTSPVTAMLYAKGDIEQVRKLVNSTIRKSILVTTIMAVIIALLGRYLIIQLFGEEYLSSYAPLLVLLIGYAIYSSYISIGATLSSINKVRVPYKISALCAMMNIVLNILLIPTIGIVGAALSTSISMILNFTLALLAIRYYLGDKCLAKMTGIGTS